MDAGIWSKTNHEKWFPTSHFAEAKDVMTKNYLEVIKKAQRIPYFQKNSGIKDVKCVSLEE